MTDDAERPSGTEGEVFDLVDRKGPITTDGLMDHIGAFSSDEVYTCLQSLESDGYVVEKEHELEQGGISYTKWMWSVDTGTDRADSNDQSDGDVNE